MPTELDAFRILGDECVGELLSRTSGPARYAFAQRMQELRNARGSLELVCVVVVPAAVADDPAFRLELLVLRIRERQRADVLEQKLLVTRAQELGFIGKAFGEGLGECWEKCRLSHGPCKVWATGVGTTPCGVPCPRRAASQ